MSSLGSPNPFFIAGKKAYEIERSLRFNSGDVTYLTRTPSSSGNRRTMTYSFWLKKCKPEAFQTVVSGRTDASNRNQIDLLGTGGIRVWGNSGGSQNVYVAPSNLLRDPSAWYHIVIAIDTTQGTSSNRVKFYFNGAQATSFSNTTYPSQDAELHFNKNVAQSFGLSDSGPDVYFAEINFIDGYAYDASYFGETDAITGQWIPKKYTGSYGTNGFYLNFSDNSGTTATTLGKDSSGNGNNFTPNNFAVSDAMKDTPTNNFATMTPLNRYSGLSQGNLRFNNYNDSSGPRSVQSSFAIPKSGKWYWEARYQEAGTGKLTTKYVGVSQLADTNTYITAPYVYYNGGSGTLRNGNASDNKDGKQIWYNGTGVPAIIAIAVDVDNNSVEYFHNGSSQGTIPLPTLTSSQEYFFHWANTASGSATTLNDTFNFGADSTFQGQTSSGGNTDANGIGDFKYAPPTGHLALCSANLPDPTIKLPNKHFNTLLWDGNNTNGRTLTGVGFQPDWAWIKCRDHAFNHNQYDTVRGANKLLINDTDAESSDNIYGYLSAFASDGYTFTQGTNANYPMGNVNASSKTYVAWNWNAGDTDGKTYTVTVVNDSGNKYRFDGFGTSAVTLDLAEGGTYIFNYPSAHPFKFSTTADGTHGGGSEYTTGVTHNSSTQVTIVVAASAPTLYYYCGSHSGMGGQVNTNSTLGSSNFDGTTQSLAKVNATAGFSIVTYTGTGSDATIGHGLGVAPKAVIVKARNGTHSWRVYFSGVTDTDGKYLSLDSNIAVTSGSDKWNGTPTSSIFGVSGDNSTGGSSVTFVSYVFSEVAGYSKFGSYTGNGSSDGTFVFTGFRPAWVLIKNSSSGSTDWILKDATIETFNVVDAALKANTNDAEASSLSSVDFLSNGFKIKNDGSFTNTNGNTFIYLAFAEAPFKNARAR